MDERQLEIFTFEVVGDAARHERGKDSPKPFPKPVPGEEKHIPKMLKDAIRFVKQNADPRDHDEIMDFLAGDVTLTVRRYLMNDANVTTMRNVVLRSVTNRIGKVRLRRLNRERFLENQTLKTKEFDECISPMEVLDRLPPDLRAIAEFALNLGRPIDHDKDVFEISFKTGIEPNELRGLLIDLMDALNGKQF